MNIPRRITQTFIFRLMEDLPEVFRRRTSSWARHNPDWDYVYCNDTEMRKEVALGGTRLGLPLVEQFDRLQFGAARADYWRYITLWLHGGVYADIDLMCLNPVAKWLPSDAELVVCQPARKEADTSGPGRFFNGFIVSTPGSIHMERVIRVVYEKVCQVPDEELSRPGSLTFDTTGPRIFRKALGNLGSSPGVTVLQIERRERPDAAKFKGKLPPRQFWLHRSGGKRVFVFRNDSFRLGPHILRHTSHYNSSVLRANMIPPAIDGRAKSLPAGKPDGK